MFQESHTIIAKREAALAQLGERHLLHPANRIERKDKEAREANAIQTFDLAAPPPERMTAGEAIANYEAGLARICAPPPMTAADLIAYYKLQSPAMQGALRAFWRTLVSIPHTGRIFDEALAHLHHEEKHGG